ncbi:hypothetical protein QTN25_000847 [Entamoeba marina]
MFSYTDLYLLEIILSAVNLCNGQIYSSVFQLLGNSEFILFMTMYIFSMVHGVASFVLGNSEKKYCAFIKSVFDETSDADPLTQFQTQAALNEIEEELNPESEMATPRNAMDED